MIDPYFDTTFFQWFSVLFSRIFSCDFSCLFPDEVQLCVLLLFASCSSLLGVLLVVQRLTMMANALSHSLLLGVVIALCVSSIGGVLWPSDLVFYLTSLGVAVATVVGIRILMQIRYVREDASNGMVFSFFCALGLVLLSLWSRNPLATTELLMGNPESLLAEDIIFAAIPSFVSLIVCFSCLRGFVVSVFDPSFAFLVGMKPMVFLWILLLSVSFTLFSAFRAIGFLVTLGFVVLPPLFARLFTDRLLKMFVISWCVGVGGAVVGLALARHILTVFCLPVSTSALICLCLSILYTIGIIVTRRWRLFAASVPPIS